MQLCAKNYYKQLPSKTEAFMTGTKNKIISTLNYWKYNHTDALHLAHAAPLRKAQNLVLCS
jgi:cell division inhibitor SulA